MDLFDMFKKDKPNVPLQNTRQEYIKPRKDESHMVNNQSKSYQNYRDTRNIKPLYSHCVQMAPIKRIYNSPQLVPAVKETVKSTLGNETYQLKRPVMSDHISVTYDIGSNDYYIKIYSAKALQVSIIEDKVNLMLRERINLKGVCWPVAKVLDIHNRFVGILIPKSRGVQLTRSIFDGKTGLSLNFPSWNKRDLCVFSYNLLNTICELHKRGIYFGYINPASIYVKGIDEFYLADTDNWQIEGYPSLSINQTFTPPEIARMEKAQKLTTVDQENYEVAVLAFMLMMPGKFPYAKRKTNDQKESIVQMSFPFAVNTGMRRSSDSARPEGLWRIVWDHLPYHMCLNFYNTFHAQGKNSLPGNRLSDWIWMNEVREYIKTLDDDKHKDSRAMFPRTYRRDAKRTFIKCQICGMEHPDFYFMKNVFVNKEKVNVWEKGIHICIPCANDKSDLSFTCKSCGKVFFYSNRTKIIHQIGRTDYNYAEQKWCNNCKKKTVKCDICGKMTPVFRVHEVKDFDQGKRMNLCGDCYTSWGNKPASFIKCRGCGRQFVFTNKDAEFYGRKGFDPPTRCPECRKKNKRR